MSIRNDNFSYPAFTDQGSFPFDPLTRREMGHYARQEEIGRFLVNAVKSSGAAIRRWAKRTQQYRELNALPDYLLKDMGFARDQISQVVTNQLKRPDMLPVPTGSSPAPAFAIPVKGAGKGAPQETPKAA